MWLAPVLNVHLYIYTSFKMAILVYPLKQIWIEKHMQAFDENLIFIKQDPKSKCEKQFNTIDLL